MVNFVAFIAFDLSMDQKITDRLVKLTEKYDAIGQDVNSFLEGLYHTSYLTYWDYIRLDTLLSLQNPKTDFEDEVVFITYHQIVELYFKLMLNELDFIVHKDQVDIELLKKRLNRVNQYARQLISSIDIMTDGIDKSQFSKFRMALLPASGFQSVQFRRIEIGSTDMINLVGIESREMITKDASAEELFHHIYWLYGATESETGKKTLTLKQFEDKYSKGLLEIAKDSNGNNLNAIYRNYYQRYEDEEIVRLLKEYDESININWRLAHFKSAVKHLKKNPVNVNSTGGTNWKKYLPPRFQMILFFPELWSDEEKENWGRTFLLQDDGI